MTDRLEPLELPCPTTAGVQATDEPAGEAGGVTLETVLWQERLVGRAARTLDEAVALLDSVAAVLNMAHASGTFHRDLNPRNIFVLGDPRGPSRTSALRRSLSASDFAPSYRAPEQFSPCYGVAGPWTDVFALALIVVELLADRVPMGDGAGDTIECVAIDPKKRPTPRALGVPLPDAVESVFENALAVFPAERFQTVGAFWSALRRAMDAPGSVLASARAEEPDAPGHPCS
jgi:eukaryotic-like serine/threonine-protein kinase